MLTHIGYETPIHTVNRQTVLSPTNIHDYIIVFRSFTQPRATKMQVNNLLIHLLLNNMIGPFR